MARKRTYTRGQQTVVPSAARTTNGDSGPLPGWAGRTAAVAKLDVTAASGTTPQPVVVVEDSPDGSTWTVRDTFATKTTTGNETRALPKLVSTSPTGGTHVRVRWTITGTTPSFTFSVQFASQNLALA